MTTIFTELNLNRHKKLVTFASQGRGEETVNYPSFEMVYETIKELPEVQFVVKPHPDESEKLHREFVAKLGLNNVVIVKNVAIKELLIASDVVMNIYSTVGIEALSMGKPLVSISLNFPKSYFPQGRGAYIAGSQKSLKAIVSRLVNGKIPKASDIKKTGRRYLFETGEAACNNVAIAADKLLK